MSTGVGAVAYTDETAPLPRGKRHDDKPQERPVTDAITDILGATYYINDKRFDFLRVQYFNRSGGVDTDREGERFVFKRFYPEVNVIVDLIPVDNDKVRLAIENKRRAVIIYNRYQKEKEKRIGYLPVFVFQRVHRQAFEAAKAKKVLELPARPEYYERMLQQKAIVIEH